MKIVIPGFIYQLQYSWEKEPRYEHWTSDTAGGEDRVVICPWDVEAEIPDKFDPRPAKIAYLQDEKAELLDKYNQSVMKIDQKIADLLAIGYEK